MILNVSLTLFSNLNFICYSKLSPVFSPNFFPLAITIAPTITANNNTLITSKGKINPPSPTLNNFSPITSTSTVNKYMLSDMYVKITKMKGVDGDTHINNIPLNYINDVCHPIYVKNDGAGALVTTTFYIKLSRPFSGTYDPATEVHNIDIKFVTVGGIHIDNINTDIIKYHKIVIG